MANQFSRQPRLIPAQEITFFHGEILCGVPARSKRALQAICQMYRRGWRVHPKGVVALEAAVLGALTSDLSDEKVRRWALSAISNLGSYRQSWSTVLAVLRKHPGEPQVVSSAIAALFKLSPDEAQKVIGGQDVISPELMALSALQTVKARDLDLRGMRINADTADATTLKLSLVLVGLDRCPEHIYDPKHTNRELVKQLGKHQEPLVSQYSAWAVAENPKLTASDLGIDLRTIEQQPDNVRSYVYRLYAAEEQASSQRHELVYMGSQDPSEEARLGLSIGLREAYYDGLDVTVLDWLFAEHSEDVQDQLLDHIARQAQFSIGYKQTALEFFEAAHDDPQRRQRMEAAAAGTPLWGEFRKKMHQEEEGLFGPERDVNVTNNFTNNGNMQGQFSMSGTATNQGDQRNMLAVGDIQKAKDALGAARHELDVIPSRDPAVEEAKIAVAKAQAEPNKGNLAIAVTALKKVEEAVKSVDVATGSLLKIGTTVAGLMALL